MDCHQTVWCCPGPRWGRPAGPTAPGCPENVMIHILSVKIALRFLEQYLSILFDIFSVQKKIMNLFFIFFCIQTVVCWLNLLFTFLFYERSSSFNLFVLHSLTIFYSIRPLVACTCYLLPEYCHLPMSEIRKLQAWKQLFYYVM